MITSEILDKLVRYIHLNNLPLVTIEKITESSRRSIVNDINQINELLYGYAVNLTVSEEDSLELSRIDLDELIESVFDNQDYLFQQERLYMVILYLFIKQDFVSVSHFQDLFKMSKNSALTDINEASTLAKEFNVDLNYSRKNGYKLTGDKIEIRKLVDRTVTAILKFTTGKWILRYLAKKWDIELYVKEIDSILDQDEEITFVAERLEGVVYLLSILEIGPVIYDNSLKLLSEEIEYIQSSKTYALASAIIERFPSLESQKSYITIQLLSVIQGNMSTDEMAYFKEIMEEIIVNVQGYTGRIFPDTENFRRRLYNHLVPSYFRMKFHIQLSNPLKNRMIEDYPDLFYLIQRSFEPLSQRLGIEITDDEVAYFVMYFGTYFNTSIEANHYKLTAVIICPHGMGTSILVNNLLSNVMPEVNFIKLMSEDYIEADIPNVDFIVSTIFYESEKPVYLVNPAMNQIELALLKRKIYERFNVETKATKIVNELFDRVQNFLTVNNQLFVKSEMDRVIDEDLKKSTQEIKDFDLGPLVTSEMITRCEQISDWRTAIRIASQPLLERAYITTNYIEAMIETIEKFGTYIVLVPEVAMPHAKPEDGGNRVGVSLLQLKESVNIENKSDDLLVPVKLFFIVSIADNYSHLGLLKKINKILENKDTVSDLIQANSKKEILKILSNFE